MEWWLSLSIILIGLFGLLIIRVPVAFCFLILNIIFAYVLWGGGSGVKQIVLSMYSSIGSFVLSPLITFVFMGEVLFHSGMAFKAVNTIDMLMGRLPGRLGLVSIASGTLFGALCGSSTASTAMLGTVLTPEMENRGYSKLLSIGTIMGSGGLAVIIPPSGPAVLLGALAEVSVGSILIAGILPGLFMALLFAIYVIGLSIIKPSMAPTYIPEKISIGDKLVATAKNLLPFSIIIFSVVGVIFLGIATPTESGALGATAAFLLAAIYRAANRDLLKKCALATVRTTVMIYFIIGGALAFSQIMAFTGSTQGMISFISGLNLPAYLIVGIMMFMVLFLGTFMDSVAIMMITLPIFMPIIKVMGFNEVQFCILLLISIETGFLTPPFGLNLFVMKGVATKGTTTIDIYKAVIPFLIINIIVIVILIFVPQITLTLLKF